MTATSATAASAFAATANDTTCMRLIEEVIMDVTEVHPRFPVDKQLLYVLLCDGHMTGSWSVTTLAERRAARISMAARIKEMFAGAGAQGHRRADGHSKKGSTIGQAVIGFRIMDIQSGDGYGKNYVKNIDDNDGRGGACPV